MTERQPLEARRQWAQNEDLDPGGVAEIFETLLRFSRAVRNEPGR